ncbi:MAG: hypothetical protein ACD_31C00005G0042 [uncultured bacterium]|uniref:NAD-dependent epimerase/dehydratase n=3 Tax=Candidatus Daviesiibacteriota TaxID=1752718 RepID=A0A0G0EYR6_9BACT|nr:MAG: hypothetical protein ACD_31C00005G0042 [uncultured bacterium]KKQ10617.1 MAG: NAD-dependent epimerase/dehydratase [Candidatus Daviesbacteria bacterium GW2011_GWB1_36_5]KKQ15748.1 MAG: NAD-dependent epimerase/dehydratase [Candidatus Daviesbacteria bacterium GW2011_GWA1_36_8]OGE17835.1 MAG: epimerase [Candidatus Daviesbacteria bacterium RIFCSPHIGHO2_01_FULL_36_37]
MGVVTDKRIFITGGAGFIGAAVTKKLFNKNKILIYDNYRRDSLQFFIKNKPANIQIIEGDILNTELLKGAIEIFKPDYVLHLAAMAGVSDYYKQPVKTMEINAIGTYSVLEAVKEIPLERFVYFSTSEVYGPLVYGAKEDGNTAQGDIKQVRWTYGISKLAGEGLSFSYAQQYKIPTSSIRPFNIYGPGQVGEGGVQIFITKAINDETIHVTGNGNQIRAWCYIDDLVLGLEAILTSKEAVGEIFNIGNPAGTITILNLAQTIIRLSGSKSKIEFIPHPGVDIDLRVPNIGKASKILKFTPGIDLEEGLKRSIEWYKKNPLIQ